MTAETGETLRVLPEYFIQTFKHHYHDMGSLHIVRFQVMKKRTVWLRRASKKVKFTSIKSPTTIFFAFAGVDQLATQGGR